MPERELTLDWKPPSEARAVSKRHRSYFGLRERVLRKVSWEGGSGRLLSRSAMWRFRGRIDSPGRRDLESARELLVEPVLDVSLDYPVRPYLRDQRLQLLEPLVGRSGDDRSSRHLTQAYPERQRQARSNAGTAGNVGSRQRGLGQPAR